MIIKGVYGENDGGYKDIGNLRIHERPSTYVNYILLETVNDFVGNVHFLEKLIVERLPVDGFTLDIAVSTGIKRGLNNIIIGSDINSIVIAVYAANRITTEQYTRDVIRILSKEPSIIEGMFNSNLGFYLKLNGSDGCLLKEVFYCGEFNTHRLAVIELLQNHVKSLILESAEISALGYVEHRLDKKATLSELLELQHFFKFFHLRVIETGKGG